MALSGKKYRYDERHGNEDKEWQQGKHSITAAHAAADSETEFRFIYVNVSRGRSHRRV